MLDRVDFETKCWEQDWRLISSPHYIGCMIDRCNFRFAKRRIIINNVREPRTVMRAFDALVAASVIDEYRLAEEFAASVLEKYAIERSSLGNGYVYSIAELVGIDASSADYILHFSSDSIMERSLRPSLWVKQAVSVLSESADIVVANPAWNWRFKKARAASEGEIGDFYVSTGFSDQCYLIKRAVFDQPIYGHDHVEAAIYPSHGGNSFERRAFCFMRMAGKKRITHKAESYWHRNVSQTASPALRRVASVSHLQWLRRVLI